MEAGSCSLNAELPIFSMILKGPRRLWSSFLLGRLVRMNRGRSQTLSLFVWRSVQSFLVREECVLFEGFGDVFFALFVNMFELFDSGFGVWNGGVLNGNGESRVITFVCVKGRHADCAMVCRVISVFGEGQEVRPIILLVGAEGPDVLFYDLIDTFGLTVGLRMERCG